VQIIRDDRPGVGAPGRSGNGNWKGIAVTKQKQNKTAAGTGLVPLRDLGMQFVLRRTQRRVNLRKAIEVSAKGGKKPNPHVLAAIIKHLRAHYGGLDDELDFIINALDPATQSDWKLEWKRRKGKPTTVDDLSLFSEYLNSCKDYEAQGMKQVHKRAVAKLAAKYCRQFGAMEAAIRRGRIMTGR
jgi:hypothetical protein